MELTETVETINKQLTDVYGMDTLSGLPIWRVVWSNDQTEKRLTEYTDSGMLLLFPEVRELPKYPLDKDKYILERLVLVPDFQQNELPAQKMSYEPLWTFEDKNSNYLPPKFNACQFIIDLVYAAQGKSSMAKYKNPEDTDPSIAQKRIDEIENELFGDESGLMGGTKAGDTVAGFHSSKVEES